MSVAAIPLLPPLRGGDRLTSAEFIRRWEAMPELKHAELIDGIVFMSSPVSTTHGDQHVSLSGWLWLYAEHTPGCRGGGESTWIMGPKDVQQPDIALRILPEYGGQSTLAGKYLGGAPELIVEVSGSSTSRDLGLKLDLYRRVGVRENLTILVNPQQVIWRQLVRERYKEIAPDEDGLLRSRLFPGLWLDPAAVWDRERSLRTAVELGTLSPEHTAFVRRLAARKRK
jgi:Uma2 family endonuclease